MITLSRSEERILDAVSAIVVPAFLDLGEREREEFRGIIDGALAARPPGIRRSLALFLKVLRLAPIVRWGRPLERLPEAAAETYLRRVERSRVAKIRQGFWGLKTLIFMGYYGREDSWAEIGYAPESGRESRPGA